MLLDKKQILVQKQVHLVISTPKEVEFAFGDQSVSKLCVGSEDTKTLFYTFVFSQLGRHNITGKASCIKTIYV